eukprot:Skav215279  [mRNA]  locus=scaffold2522:44866:51867:- [translate_table: standard]
MHVRMHMPRVQPAMHAVHRDGCSQIRWRSADSGAETSRDPGDALSFSHTGTVGLPSGSRSSTETLPGECLPLPPHLLNAEAAPIRFTSEPNRHELQATQHHHVWIEELPNLALTPGSTSRSDEGAYSRELMELLSAISAAARRQSAEAQKQLQQDERLAAKERLAACEAHSTQLREELQSLKLELQEQQRIQEQLEQRLSQREEELQEAARRAEERNKAQEIQIAELRERLQEAYEAQHQHQMRELIHAAAQEANILPREEPAPAVGRHLFSPLTADSAVSSANSTFVFDGEASGEPSNNAAAKACRAGVLQCSPLSGAPSPKLDGGSLISSLAPSSEVVVEHSPTESLSPALANLERSPGVRPARPPSAAIALPPGRMASLDRGRAAPSPHGTGSSLYALSSSEGSQQAPLEGNMRTAPPRGYVAEKIIFFDRQTPSSAPRSQHGPSRRPSPVPTPLGRHVLPASPSRDTTGRSRVFGSLDSQAKLSRAKQS